jgi:hypothetical protein
MFSDRSLISESKAGHLVGNDVAVDLGIRTVVDENRSLEERAVCIQCVSGYQTSRRIVVDCSGSTLAPTVPTLIPIEEAIGDLHVAIVAGDRPADDLDGVIEELASAYDQFRIENGIDGTGIVIRAVVGEPRVFDFQM